MSSVTHPEVRPEVLTSCGTIRGRRTGAVDAYRGIPYAAPPTGANRWMPPRPAAPWTTTLDAGECGPAAPQVHGGALGGLVPDMEPATFDEDCLSLNVWAPVATAPPRAVLVWLHGGAFSIGSSSLATYDATWLAANEDIVVVSVNYRLGALGFLVLDLPGTAANCGLLDQVAALAASRSFHLNSAFRPTYNMAANLVRSYTSERAHHLLNLSFAQYQADREVVRLEARLERRQRQLDELLERSASPYGDIDEYRRMTEREQPAPSGPAVRDDPVSLGMMRVRPGDILYVEKGRYAGRVAVLTSAFRKGGVKLTVLTTRRDVLTLTTTDFDEAPTVIGRLELPSDFAPNRTDYQRHVVTRLERAEVATPQRRRGRAQGPEGYPYGHPVESDPDLEDRLKAAAQARRAAREVEELRTRMGGRGQSVALDFDRVLGILRDWG